MNKKVLIVDDQFAEATDLQMMLTKAGYEVYGIARSVPIAMGMIKKERPGLVLLNIFVKGKLTGIDLAKQLKEDNIAFIYLSANSNEEILSAAKTTEPAGFIVKPFREKDLLITLQIAQYRHEHSMESYFRQENILRDKLSAIIAAQDTVANKLFNICKTLQPYISFDYAAAGFNTLNKESSQGLSFLRIGYGEYQVIGIPELLTISGLKLNELSTLVNNTYYDPTPVRYIENTFEQLSREPTLNRLFSSIFQIRSYVSLPLHLTGGEMFTFCFYCQKPDTYTTYHIGLLNLLQPYLTTGIESILNGAKNHGSVSVPKTENTTAPGNTAVKQEFEGIIGNSQLLLNVFDHIAQVAPFDTAVLILGESGTGKERIADCIHNLSSRKGKDLVKVNCATLPATLIESELFGHEKGSFTGAANKRIGKFEQANGGTLFLDEIGEMPVDLQVKLLRVLQEKEIEPIGSRSVVKINVRIIAATNRNLEKEVAEGRFRLDLYYRLNVFPIEMPPLRDRPEDIPALANHFINYYNRKAGKKILGLSDHVVKNMISYQWPGNIRELENLIERAILLTKGTIIDEIALPLSQKKEAHPEMKDSRMKTIHENERDYITSVLKKCNGRIWGTGGAAEILNIPPTTLKSKMKKHGILKG